MILSDGTIARYVEDEYIKVEPYPEPEQVQPASLDVCIGDEVYYPQHNRSVDSHETVTVQPGYPLLCTTQERVELPRDVAAQLTGRSSVGRRGVVVHQTAGFIDPGFKGNITLEMCNFSNEPQTFGVGTRIAQLIFFELDRESKGYDGQYQNQDGVVTGGKLS